MGEAMVEEEIDSLDGLAGRELVDCTFTGVNAEAGVLDRVRLEGCTFRDCHLRNASVVEARMSDTTFIGTNLAGIDWTTASWSRFSISPEMRFVDCVLDFGTFRGLALQGLVAYACKMVDVDFEECDLTQADLRFSDLEQANFNRATLVGADLSGATGYGFDPRDTRARDTKVSMPSAARLLAPLGFDVVPAGQPQSPEEFLREPGA